MEDNLEEKRHEINSDFLTVLRKHGIIGKNAYWVSELNISANSEEPTSVNIKILI